MPMKLVSVNIEGSRHLEKIKSLLISENADVVCLAECFADTIEFLSSDKYPYQLHVPTYLVDQDNEYKLIPSNERRWGEVILSKYPLKETKTTYLSMDPYTETNLPTHGTDNHIPAFIQATVEIRGVEYRIGTIHLTWTPRASMTDRQRLNVSELLTLVKDQEIVMCGDFNVPRGNEVYDQIASKFSDNIPPSIESTIDPDLHYRNVTVSGTLKLVVDYVWSSEGYRVSDVEVISGVSDHCAITCLVEKI